MKLSLQGPSGLVCSMTIKDEMLFAGTADGRIMAWKFPAKEIDPERMEQELEMVKIEFWTRKRQFENMKREWEKNNPWVSTPTKVVLNQRHLF